MHGLSFKKILRSSIRRASLPSAPGMYTDPRFAKFAVLRFSIGKKCVLRNLHTFSTETMAERYFSRVKRKNTLGLLVLINSDGKILRSQGDVSLVELWGEQSGVDPLLSSRLVHNRSLSNWPNEYPTR